MGAVQVAAPIVRSSFHSDGALAPHEPSTVLEGNDGTDAAGSWLVSRYAVASETLEVAGALRQIVHSTRSGSTLVVESRHWRAASEGSWDLVPTELVSRLIECQFVVPSDQDELRLVLDENSTASSIAAELVQVIQPSAACQLGCFYCGQEHSAQSLAEHRQDALLRRIHGRLEAASASSSPFERLNVGWFGAEPLLGMVAMRSLSPRLIDLADQFGCSYSSRVVTNGLRLTPSIARELQDRHKVKYVEITLDGTAVGHDARRATKAGKGSFDKIFENLRAVASDSRLVFELVIRCNVDASNASLVPDLIDLLAEHNIQRRAKLYFSPVYSWGNDAHEGSLPPERYADLEITWLAKMIEHGYTVDLLPERRPIVCLALQRGGRVTDAFGTEFNCTEAPYVPAYGKPNMYAVGHVDDRDDPARPLFFQSWHQDIAEHRHSPCGSCPILPVCGGACPKAWHDGNPPCPAVKHNIRDRMLLTVTSAATAFSGLSSRAADPQPGHRHGQEAAES